MYVYIYLHINNHLTLYTRLEIHKFVFLQVGNFWTGYKLKLVPCKSLLFNKDTSILRNLDVIELEINYSLESLNGINNSPYIMTFKVCMYIVPM